MTGGGGSDGHISNNIIVSPTLPDDLSGLNFIFRENQTPFKGKSTGLEIVMHFD